MKKTKIWTLPTSGGEVLVNIDNIALVEKSQPDVSLVTLSVKKESDKNVLLKVLFPYENIKKKLLNHYNDD